MDKSTDRKFGVRLRDSSLNNALKTIEGRWKLPVMYLLCANCALRYNELKKALDITDTMLTSTLKELEADGLVCRTEYMEVPRRVEYSVTPKGRRLMPALQEISLWGEQLGDADGHADQKRQQALTRETEAGGTTIGRKGCWKYQYEDGGYVHGTLLTDPVTGEVSEIPRWKYIQDAWWCFGADGKAKTGLVYDANFRGWFYIDRNGGMCRGWKEIEGKWRYFDPSDQFVAGRMLSDIWVDGLHVDEDGVWDGGKDPADAKGPGRMSDQAAFSGTDAARVFTEARVSIGLTQKQLEERTGIGHAEISKIEKNISNPSIARLKRLAEGMDMELKLMLVPGKAVENKEGQ